MRKIRKLYAAYKAGFLGNNILDTYFSFAANIIIQEHISVVEDTIVAEKMKEQYLLDLPLPFIRQILGVGVQKKCFVEDHGKYSVLVEEIEKYKFSESGFDALWSKLISEFEIFCRQKEIDISSIQTEEFVLKVLDDSDDLILSGEKVENENGITPAEYGWYSFVKSQSEMQTELYTFIAAISISNITKQALFYSGEGSPDYSDLHVYLDSPIIFALLGMDENARTESYKRLIQDMQKARCNVHVLDHNYQEVDSIIASAATWATSTQYDIRKANNAARFFHDSQMDETKISEFCDNIEEKLNDLGITVVGTDYDIFQAQFQEDETTLFEMVKDRYLEHGYELTQEKQNSIRIDVRSIVMIYRKRQGQTATRLQHSKHIMLTSNNAIANVSKKYESNRSTQHGHIPACISADLFGAVLWLNSPTEMMEYQKQKVLADCYAFLRPDKKLLEKYIKSLDDARNADEIDEKKFLFLRTHKVVLDSLMDITKGDYARFSASTYLEVYEDIQAKSQKMYRDEAAAHKQTQEELQNVKVTAADEKEQSEQTIKELRGRVALLEQKENDRIKKDFERKVLWIGRVVSLIVVGVPYIVTLVLIEFFKARFALFTWKSAIGIAVAIVLTSIAALIYSKGCQCCYKWVRSYLLRKDKSIS